MHLANSPEQFLSFQTTMLAAVRVNRKSVTRRRITQFPPLLDTPGNYHFQGVSGGEVLFMGAGGQLERVASPFGRPGDHLRVTEAPEIQLEVLRVWAERVQAISEEQALAEGITAYQLPSGVMGYGVEDKLDELATSAVAAFQMLITTIYPDAWARNEWVWVLEFRRVA